MKKKLAEPAPMCTNCVWADEQQKGITMWLWVTGCVKEEGNKMPEVKDWITYAIALLGVGVTAAFSYLVWKATKESVNVTKASLELSKSIALASESEYQALRKSYRTAQMRRITEAVEALAFLRDTFSVQKIYAAPTDAGLDEIVLAKYFSYKDQMAIHDAWEIYVEYLNTYLRQGNGEWSVGGWKSEVADKMRENTKRPIDKFAHLVAYLETTI